MWMLDAIFGKHFASSNSCQCFFSICTHDFSVSGTDRGEYATIHCLFSVAALPPAHVHHQNICWCIEIWGVECEHCWFAEFSFNLCKGLFLGWLLPWSSQSGCIACTKQLPIRLAIPRNHLCSVILLGELRLWILTCSLGLLGCQVGQLHAQ